MIQSYIDTHTHLYDEQFSEDIEQVIQTAIDKGVDKFLLPNCDSNTLSSMLNLSKRFPLHCFPMIGLHPVYVKEDYLEELAIIEKALLDNKCIAIGEIGLDYYWDKTFIKEQKDAFKTQIHWAKETKLPISIHTRDSIDDGIDMITSLQDGNLQGVFHCFSGDLDQAKRIIDVGFKMGIGGVLTFKNSELKNFIKAIPLENIILETDAPYLAPVPYRGKRNESSYIPIIAEHLANCYEKDIQEIASATSQNAIDLFQLYQS